MMDELKTHDKREHILNVAECLFAAHGFEAVSIREISKEADINIAMVSYYFGSKDKLYEEVVQRKLIPPDTILIAIEKYTTYTDKLFAIVDIYTQRLFENRQFQNIIFREMAMNQRSAMTDVIVTQVHKSFSMLIDVIQKGIKTKEFKKVDIELTAMSVIAIIKMYTNSSRMACKMMHLQNAEEAFDTKNKNRLRKHLREILSNHLGIKNN